MREMQSKTLFQTEAFYRAHGWRDAEVQVEMRHLRCMAGTPSIVLWGRLSNLSTKSTGASANTHLLCVQLRTCTCTYALELDLGTFIAQSLVRRLSQADPTEDLAIELWDSPRGTDTRRAYCDHLVNVVQGQYLLEDVFVGNPWVPRQGECADVLGNPAYLERMFAQALRELPIEWYLSTIETIASRIDSGSGAIGTDTVKPASIRRQAVTSTRESGPTAEQAAHSPAQAEFIDPFDISRW